ncbi:MAG: hypothetical protein AAGG57_00635 [Pseudomonadota bacterium]
MDWYSRLIAWLKVLFPLAALALLSTLFLLSRNTDLTANLPYAEEEIKNRARDQQVTEPFFSGTTPAGDRLTIAASRVTSPVGNATRSEATDLSARIDLADGPRINVSSAQGLFDLAGRQTSFRGDVLFVTSDGYRIATEALDAGVTDEISVISPGAVDALSPIGELSAGSLAMTSAKEGKSAQLVFKDGVRLIYDPKSLEE